MHSWLEQKFPHSFRICFFMLDRVCVPTVQGIPPPEGLNEQQTAAWHKDAAFLAQLLDNTKVIFYSHRQFGEHVLAQMLMGRLVCCLSDLPVELCPVKCPGQADIPATMPIAYHRKQPAV